MDFSFVFLRKAGRDRLLLAAMRSALDPKAEAASMNSPNRYSTRVHFSGVAMNQTLFRCALAEFIFMNRDGSAFARDCFREMTTLSQRDGRRCFIAGHRQLS